MIRAYSRLVVISGLVGLFFTSPSFSQSINIAPRAGLYLEDTDPYIGFQVDIELFSIPGLHIVPSIDNVMADEDTDGLDLESQWLLSLNATYDFFEQPFGTLYLGIGTGIFRSKLDATNKNDTQPVLNVLGGLRFNVIGKLKPFANLRVTTGDESSIILEAGLHFTVF